MKNNKLLLICLSFVLFSLPLSAQTYYSYTHDATGNRIKRMVIQGPEKMQPGDAQVAAREQQEEPTELDKMQRNAFKVFPNPASDIVNFEAINQVTDGELSLVDATGKVLWREALNGQGTTFDVSNYPAGNYFLQFKYPEGGFVWTIVKAL